MPCQYLSVCTLCMGSVTKYYYFFAFIEIATTLFIVFYASQWLRKKDIIAVGFKAKNSQV